MLLCVSQIGNFVLNPQIAYFLDLLRVKNTSVSILAVIFRREKHEVVVITLTTVLNSDDMVGVKFVHLVVFTVDRVTTTLLDITLLDVPDVEVADTHKYAVILTLATKHITQGLYQELVPAVCGSSC